MMSIPAQRALSAHEAGQFRDEIVEVRVTQPKSSDTLVKGRD